MHLTVLKIEVRDVGYAALEVEFPQDTPQLQNFTELYSPRTHISRIRSRIMSQPRGTRRLRCRGDKKPQQRAVGKLAGNGTGTLNSS